MKHESVFPTGVAIGGGMTKRQYFAIKILQSMVSRDTKKDKPNDDVGELVDTAIHFADALLEALDGQD